MSRDDLKDIPSFTANRDEAVSSAPRGAIPARAARAEAVMASGGAAEKLTAFVTFTQTVSGLDAGEPGA